jgi:hypothetical protein
MSEKAVLLVDPHVVDTKKTNRLSLTFCIVIQAYQYHIQACYCIQRFKHILPRNTTLEQLGIHMPAGGQHIILHEKNMAALISVNA